MYKYTARFDILHAMSYSVLSPVTIKSFISYKLLIVTSDERWISNVMTVYSISKCIRRMFVNYVRSESCILRKPHRCRMLYEIGILIFK